MSDRAKPWLENWYARGHNAWDRVTHQRVVERDADTPEHAELIAAAPGLARALCRVEWGSFRDISYYESQEEVCPACDCPPVKITNRYGVVTPGGHAPDCPLDAALAAAGLTAEDREEVRRG